LTSRCYLKRILQNPPKGIALSHSAASDLKFNKPKNPAHVINGQGNSRLLLICEHASNHIPARYAGLGMTDAAKISHAAWDPGAQAISERLSTLLDAPLVVNTVSRLVYDCNRPPSSPCAMRAVSEQIVIPGNESLSDADKAERVETVYTPFTQTVSDTIKAFPSAPVLVTVHSFTRVYNGKKRDVDIGIIHDRDTRLAKAMLTRLDPQQGLNTALNKPYSKADGVSHTLELHGTENGLMNVMIEVCNDLIETPEQQDGIARMLADALTLSLADLGQDVFSKGSTC
jgi:predicted N-formylglutamate amidohydrolase